MKSHDEEIIELMRGEKTREKGLQMLMDAYQSRLYWHIRRIVVQHELSQDVLQDTFVKVYQNFAQFKGDSRLYTWLYRIATNEAIQQLTRLKKFPKKEDIEENTLQNIMAENTVEEADEIQLLLEKALQTLPEKQKLVFTMRYYDEISYEDLSEILGMSISTLKTNYHYAKNKIEDYIIENHDKL